MAEEPKETEEVEEPLEGRIELLEITCHVGDVISWIDPEHEEPGRPAGMERHEPVALLDLYGHIHPPREFVVTGEVPACIPMAAPFQCSLENLDTLLKGLGELRAALVEKIGDQDRA